MQAQKNETDPSVTKQMSRDENRPVKQESGKSDTGPEREWEGESNESQVELERANSSETRLNDMGDRSHLSEVEPGHEQNASVEQNYSAGSPIAGDADSVSA